MSSKTSSNLSESTLAAFGKWVRGITGVLWLLQIICFGMTMDAVSRNPSSSLPVVSLIMAFVSSIVTWTILVIAAAQDSVWAYACLSLVYGMSTACAISIIPAYPVTAMIIIGLVVASIMWGASYMSFKYYAHLLNRTQNQSDQKGSDV